jgi:hypothetical protein
MDVTKTSLRVVAMALHSRIQHYTRFLLPWTHNVNDKIETKVHLSVCNSSPSTGRTSGQPQVSALFRRFSNLPLIAVWDMWLCDDEWLIELCYSTRQWILQREGHIDAEEMRIWSIWGEIKWEKHASVDVTKTPSEGRLLFLSQLNSAIHLIYASTHLTLNSGKCS